MLSLVVTTHRAVEIEAQLAEKDRSCTVVTVVAAGQGKLVQGGSI